MSDTKGLEASVRKIARLWPGYGVTVVYENAPSHLDQKWNIAIKCICNHHPIPNWQVGETYHVAHASTLGEAIAKALKGPADMIAKAKAETRDCPHCNWRFMTPAVLKQHIAEKHAEGDAQ